ncbi:MAG: hypothetical protein HY608_06535 [Planctomycetes bacterium]|nr:hypothetical protein [Planctomycetota bacterium]
MMDTTASTNRLAVALLVVIVVGGAAVWWWVYPQMRIAAIIADTREQIARGDLHEDFALVNYAVNDKRLASIAEGEIETLLLSGDPIDYATALDVSFCRHHFSGPFIKHHRQFIRDSVRHLECEHAIMPGLRVCDNALRMLTRYLKRTWGDVDPDEELARLTDDPIEREAALGQWRSFLVELEARLGAESESGQ